jgi:hypothetical protein
MASATGRGGHGDGCQDRAIVPGLPMKRDRIGMTHDCKRNGTVNLMVAGEKNLGGEIEAAVRRPRPRR